MTTTFLPPRDAGKTLHRNGWKIETHKLPILNSLEIDALTTAVGITPPEMIFGHNSVALTHEPSGWGISFRAADALALVDKTGEGMLKVAYSENWQKMRERVHEDIKDIVRPFDWSYTTDYRGSVHEPEGLQEGSKMVPAEQAQIPFAKLRQPDPILLFDDVVLYEDELADNGISMLSVKVRVMPERLLVLQRFFLRLDGVVFRIRDTRVYVEFETGEVIREYQAKEDSYVSVRKGMYMHSPEEIPSLMRDSNYISDMLPIVETKREKVVVK